MLQMALKENVLYKKVIFRATRGQGKRRKSGVGSKSPSLKLGWRGVQAMDHEWFLKYETKALILKNKL